MSQINLSQSKIFTSQLKFLIRSINIYVFLCLECKFHSGFLKFLIWMKASDIYIYKVTIGEKWLFSFFQNY